MFYLAHPLHNALAIHNYNRELRKRESRVLSFHFVFSSRFRLPLCPRCLRVHSPFAYATLSVSSFFSSSSSSSFSFSLSPFPSPPRLFFNFSLAVLGGERERWPLAGSSLDAVSLQVSFRMRRRERGPSSLYSIRNDAAKVREYTRLFG